MLTTTEQLPGEEDLLGLVLGDRKPRITKAQSETSKVRQPEEEGYSIQKDDLTVDKLEDPSNS